MYLTISTVSAQPSPSYRGRGDSDQPQLVRFSGVVTGWNGREQDQLVTLVKPVGFPDQLIGHKTFDVQMFSRAMRSGLAPEEVLNWIETQARSAIFVIGHDIHDDLRVLTRTAAMLGRPFHAPSNTFSTMYGCVATGLVQLETSAAVQVGGTLRDPTLSECFERVTKRPLEGASGIRSHAHATSTVFHHICRLLVGDEPYVRGSNPGC